QKKIEYKEIVDDGIMSERLIFQASFDDRISYYKTFVRESFAKKQSVIICLPTIHDIEHYQDALKKGIEEYTFIFHSDEREVTQLEHLKKLRAETHPVLLLITPGFLGIPRHDLGTLIIERESSSAFKSLRRPYIDARIFAELYARHAKMKFILGDTLLRPETLLRKDSGELGEVAPPTFRMSSSERLRLVDTRREKNEVGFRQTRKIEWRALSDELISEIKKTLDHTGHCALFALRKGLAPLTVCNDCGTTLPCPKCNAPLVLYKGATPESRVFMCNKCGEESDSHMNCGVCGSWNLAPLGIGTERVLEEIKALFPDVPLYVFDKDTVSTRKKGDALAKQFYKEERAIALGTEVLFNYLKHKVRLTAVVSFDSLFSIPSFRINEKALFVLYTLHNLSENITIIQTKYPENDVLKAFIGSNLLELYREELKIRKILKYPPWSTIIKLSVSGNLPAVEKEQIRLNEEFKDFEGEYCNSFIKRIGDIYMLTLVLKVPRLEWTLSSISKKGRLNPTLSRLLTQQPPYMRIIVDPDDVL
ncbi:MAG: PriA 3primeBD protein, partial [Patescibacteria group bacterium]|nr:PriA 3primeBD protein [Patescibacteria group bacterium]